jgi:glycosyltransferase involved in cell wall biosynthesis
MKVLHLASWYPNKADPFSGDFIKRHSQAVSIYLPVYVIYIGKYAQETKAVTSYSKSTANGLYEFIVYYSTAINNKSFYSKVLSLYHYFDKHISVIRKLRKVDGLPDIVHVHIAMKAGLIGLYLKWKYNIPYVLTEHWSGYYEFSRDSLFKKSFLTKYFTKLILRHAARTLTVSHDLGVQINQNWVKVPFQKIPNVVNTSFFSPSAKPPDVFRFIHVSTLAFPKNPEGIVRAFCILVKQGISAELVLVGAVPPDLRAQIQRSGCSTQIMCTEEIVYEQVAEEMRASSCLVVFSYYENMPCVVLEALCTGIPVIASRVGGMPEVIHQQNGILVTAGDEQELLAAMKKMIERYPDYNRAQIAKEAARAFSYETVGQEILAVYDEVLRT